MTSSPTTHDTILQRGAALEAYIASSPFARLLGIRCDVRGDEMTAIMPFEQQIVGNVFLPAIHGGAIGAFLEICGVAQVYLSSDVEHPPRPINITVDYLRSAGPRTLYGRAHIHRMGRRIANVRIEAWQERRDKPVAAMTAHFLLKDTAASQDAAQPPATS